MTLRVFGGGAVKGLVGALAADFEARHGCRIEGEFSAVGAMRERVVAGEPVDVVILSRALIDGLARDGYVLGDTIADLGRVPTGLAVRAGDPVPAIEDESTLAATLASMDAIYAADPQRATAGIHFAKVLAELGLSETLAPRLHAFPTGTVAMRELAAARGGRRLGCTQVTEIVATPGLTLVGTLPKRFELVTVYTAAVAGRGATELSRAFVAALAADTTLDLRRRLGFTAPA